MRKMPSSTEIEKGEIVGRICSQRSNNTADKVVDAVKTGAKKFFVMAGCDGRMKAVNTIRNLQRSCQGHCYHDSRLRNIVTTNWTLISALFQEFIRQ